MRVVSPPSLVFPHLRHVRVMVPGAGSRPFPINSDLSHSSNTTAPFAPRQCAIMYPVMAVLIR
jgi:hypothetical protein